MVKAFLGLIIIAVFAVSLNQRQVHEERSNFLWGIYYNSGFDPNAGVVFLDYLTRIEPHNKAAFSKLAQCYKQLGQERDAQRVLQRSLPVHLREVYRWKAL